jgi:hypothetical protein
MKSHADREYAGRITVSKAFPGINVRVDLRVDDRDDEIWWVTLDLLDKTQRSASGRDLDAIIANLKQRLQQEERRT